MSAITITDVIPDTAEEFPALFADQSEDVILQRWIDWANEGLDPVQDADQWVDTREGSHWRTPITPALREVARLYDLMGSEVPMSGFVLWAWETYLDDLGAVYEVYRLQATQATGIATFAAPPGTTIDAGVRIGVLPINPDDPAPTFDLTAGGVVDGTGLLDLPFRATDAGSLGMVSAGAVDQMVTPFPIQITVTNSAPTLGGTDTENDDLLRKRILEAIAGKGPGAIRDYVRWAGAWPGVGKVSVVPVWRGASTVLVMIADPAGLPLPDAVVTALQQDLDPIPATGSGTAPVGAHVTVETSIILNIDIAATGITFETGYTWDGAGGTVAVGPRVQAQTTKYLLAVPPGGEAVFKHLEGILATYPGVHDVTGFTVNGGTANVAVGLDPPQVPELNSYTVS